MPSKTRSRKSGAGVIRRTAGIMTIVAIAVLTLAACSGSASQTFSGVGNSVGTDGAGGAGKGGASYAAPSAGGSVNGGNGTGSAPGSNPNAPNEPVRDEALIVKTGSMTVEVASVDEAMVKARTTLTGLGGFISGSQQSTDSGRAMASVTYRFPSARWEDALDAIRKLGKLIEARTQSTEVTGQVLDLGARIDNLRATERALQSIMAKATKIPDILSVQQQLTGVQGEIEQLTTQQSHLRDQASLSTLTVLYQVPAAPVVTETSKAWSPSTEFDRAVALLLSVGQGLATLGIWLLVVALPIGLGVLVLVVLIGWVARRAARLPIVPAGPSTTAGPDA